jgi:hypothetical protein
MFAFRHNASDGTFIGSITDPMPVAWHHNRITVPALASDG